MRAKIQILLAWLLFWSAAAFAGGVRIDLTSCPLTLQEKTGIFARIRIVNKGNRKAVLSVWASWKSPVRFADIQPKSITISSGRTYRGNFEVSVGKEVGTGSVTIFAQDQNDPAKPIYSARCAVNIEKQHEIVFEDLRAHPSYLSNGITNVEVVAHCTGGDRVYVNWWAESPLGAGKFSNSTSSQTEWHAPENKTGRDISATIYVRVTDHRAGTKNAERSISVTIPPVVAKDVTPPSIGYIQINPTTTREGGSVQISADVSDENGVETVFAQYKKEEFRMKKQEADQYAVTIQVEPNDSSAEISHTITIIARDMNGNEAQESIEVVQAGKLLPMHSLNYGKLNLRTAQPLERVNNEVFRLTGGEVYLSSVARQKEYVRIDLSGETVLDLSGSPLILNGDTVLTGDKQEFAAQSATLTLDRSEQVKIDAPELSAGANSWIKIKASIDLATGDLHLEGDFASLGIVTASYTTNLDNSALVKMEGKAGVQLDLTNLFGKPLPGVVLLNAGYALEISQDYYEIGLEASAMSFDDPSLGIGYEIVGGRIRLYPKRMRVEVVDRVTLNPGAPEVVGIYAELLPGSFIDLNTFEVNGRGVLGANLANINFDVIEAGISVNQHMLKFDGLAGVRVGDWLNLKIASGEGVIDLKNGVLRFDALFSLPLVNGSGEVQISKNKTTWEGELKVNTGATLASIQGKGAIYPTKISVTTAASSAFFLDAIQLGDSHLSISPDAIQINGTLNTTAPTGKSTLSVKGTLDKTSFRGKLEAEATLLGIEFKADASVLLKTEGLWLAENKILPMVWDFPFSLYSKQLLCLPNSVTASLELLAAKAGISADQLTAYFYSNTGGWEKVARSKNLPCGVYLKSPVSMTPSAQAMKGKTAYSPSLVIKLKQGWNLIGLHAGSPMMLDYSKIKIRVVDETTLDLADESATDFMLPVFVRYDAVKQKYEYLTNGLVMPPYEAFWVYSKKDIDLNFDASLFLP